MFFKKLRIKYLCRKYGIEDYTINLDGSIDVYGDVDIIYLELKKIPLKFRNIIGNFYCYNNKLKSLKNSPISVSGNFDCCSNKLTSLEHCPNEVGIDFHCSYNQLISLKFMPIVNGSFFCDNNNIRNFKYFKEPGGNFYCRINTIYNIWELFKDKSYVELLNDYDCIRGENIVINRLNEFLEEIDKRKVNGVIRFKNI